MHMYMTLEWTRLVYMYSVTVYRHVMTKLTTSSGSQLPLWVK